MIAGRAPSVAAQSAKFLSSLSLSVSLSVDMFKFLDIIEREIPTYCGNYYDDSVKCDEVALLKCYKNDKTHIRGTKLTMLTPIIEGHDVLCISMANLYPDLYCKL